MSLIDHAIWWHVYPLGTLGAPIRAWTEADHAPRLRTLEAWLEYAVQLGCSGLLLGPIFASSTHGYDTLDHFRIDPRLGDESDWEHLVAAAHQRGLSIMLDGVFNHVGVHHPWVDAALRGEGGVVRTEGDGTRAAPWEGHGDLAELNHADPAVADLVTDVMLHWLRRGAAGWRLDVAYAVPPEFWANVLGRVRAEFPDAVFLGEVIHGEYGQIAQAGNLDSVTQYELWKGVWGSLTDRNLWELSWALQRHDEFSQQAMMNTFVGNHDVNRIASLVGDAGAALAAVVLFTVPGMPSVYYGDEQAFRGVKGEGEWADDPLRPALPPSPAGLAPEGEWLLRVHQELIGIRRRNPWLVHSRLRVLAQDNLWIRYAATGAGHELEVELRLDPAASARLTLDGAELRTWTW